MAHLTPPTMYDYIKTSSQPSGYIKGCAWRYDPGSDGVEIYLSSHLGMWVSASDPLSEVIAKIEFWQNNPQQGVLPNGLPGQSPQAPPSNSPGPLAGASDCYHQVALTGQFDAQQRLLQQYNKPGCPADAPKPPPPIILECSEIHVGELIGIRGWKVRHGYLHSLARDTFWAPDEVMHGKVPSNSDCGIYAFRSVSHFLSFALQGYSDLVWGKVALWGDVVEHELGYRAEHAKLLSLEDTFKPSAKINLEELRHRYHV